MQQCDAEPQKPSDGNVELELSRAKLFFGPTRNDELVEHLYTTHEDGPIAKSRISEKQNDANDHDAP